MLTPFQPVTHLSYQAPPGQSGCFEPARERKLRIAFLVPEDRQTGTYFRYHNLAIALQEVGHKVIVYSQSSDNRLRHSVEFRDGVRYVLSATVPGNRWMIPPTNPATFVRRLFTRVEPADVYHLFQPFPTAAFTWLWLKKRRPGLFVYDWDDFWINEEFGLKNPRGFQRRWAAFWIARLEKKLPSLCDLTTTVSHPLADLALKWKSPKSAVIYNGVWPQAPQNKQEARAALNLKQDAFYVGLMGWSGEVEWCLEALRRYKSRFPSLRLAVTGRNPAEIMDRYSDIRSRVDILGALPTEKFTFFNPALDLGLVPMRASEFNHYRLPYKLTDHLAGGTPVLCSRIGEAARLAEEFDGIFTCEPTFEEWLNAFGKTVDQLQGGHEPPATGPLFKRLAWIRIAGEMREAYRSAMPSLRSHQPQSFS